MLTLLQAFGLCELVLLISSNLVVGQDAGDGHENDGTSECNEALPCSIGYVCSNDGLCLPEVDEYRKRKSMLNDEKDYIDEYTDDEEPKLKDESYDSDYDIDDKDDNSNRDEMDEDEDEAYSYSDDDDDDDDYDNGGNEANTQYDNDYDMDNEEVEEEENADAGQLVAGATGTDKDQFDTGDYSNELYEDDNIEDDDDIISNDLEDMGDSIDDMFDFNTVTKDDKESDVDIFKDNGNQNTGLDQIPDKYVISAGDAESNDEVTIDTNKSPSDDYQTGDSAYDINDINSDSNDIDDDDVMDIDGGVQDYTITYNLDSSSLEPIKKVKRLKRAANVFHPQFPTTYDMEDFRMKKSTCIRLPKGYTQETIRALIEKNEMEKEENRSEFEEPMTNDGLIDEMPEMLEPVAAEDDYLKTPNEAYMNEEGGITIPSDGVDVNININDSGDINSDSMIDDSDFDITNDDDSTDNEMSDYNSFGEENDIKQSDLNLDSMLGKDLSQEEREKVIDLIKLKLGTVIQEANTALNTLQTVRIKRDDKTEGSGEDYEIGTEKTEEIVKRDAMPEAPEKGGGHYGSLVRAQRFARQYVTRLLGNEKDNREMARCRRIQMMQDIVELKRFARHYLKEKFRMKKEYLPLSWLELNMRITEYIDNTWETTNIGNMMMAKKTIMRFIDRLYDELMAERIPPQNYVEPREKSNARIKSNAHKNKSDARKNNAKSNARKNNDARKNDMKANARKNNDAHKNDMKANAHKNNIKSDARKNDAMSNARKNDMKANARKNDIKSDARKNNVKSNARKNDDARKDDMKSNTHKNDKKGRVHKGKKGRMRLDRISRQRMRAERLRAALRNQGRTEIIVRYPPGYKHSIPTKGLPPGSIIRRPLQQARYLQKKSVGFLPLGGNVLGAFSAANAVSEAGENFQQRVTGFSNRAQSYIGSGGSIATPTIIVACVSIVAALLVIVFAL